MLKNFFIFFVVSIAVAILSGIILDVDFKSSFGVGLVIGYWLLAAGISLLISHLPAGIFWLIKRRRMPGVFGILWVSWAFLAVLCFVGNYVSGLKDMPL